MQRKYRYTYGYCKGDEVIDTTPNSPEGSGTIVDIKNETESTPTTYLIYFPSLKSKTLSEGFGSLCEAFGGDLQLAMFPEGKIRAVRASRRGPKTMEVEIFIQKFPSKFAKANFNKGSHCFVSFFLWDEFKGYEPGKVIWMLQELGANDSFELVQYQKGIEPEIYKVATEAIQASSL
jgi:hypothetical protein